MLEVQPANLLVMSTSVHNEMSKSVHNENILHNLIAHAALIIANITYTYAHHTPSHACMV